VLKQLVLASMKLQSLNGYSEYNCAMPLPAPERKDAQEGGVYLLMLKEAFAGGSCCSMGTVHNVIAPPPLLSNFCLSLVPDLLVAKARDHVKLRSAEDWKGLSQLYKYLAEWIDALVAQGESPFSTKKFIAWQVG